MFLSVLDEKFSHSLFHCTGKRARARVLREVLLTLKQLLRGEKKSVWPSASTGNSHFLIAHLVNKKTGPEEMDPVPEATEPREEEHTLLA